MGYPFDNTQLGNPSGVPGQPDQTSPALSEAYNYPGTSSSYLQQNWNQTDPSLGSPTASSSGLDTSGTQYAPSQPGTYQPGSGSSYFGGDGLNGTSGAYAPTGPGNAGGVWKSTWGGDVNNNFQPGQTPGVPPQEMPTQGYPQTGYPQAGYPQQPGDVPQQPAPASGQSGGNNGVGLPDSGSTSGSAGSSDFAGPVKQPSVLGTAFWGGVGAYTFAGPLPRLLNRASDAIVEGSDSTLGTSLLGENSWLSKTFPKAAPTLDNLGSKLNGLFGEAGPLTRAAGWWQKNYTAPVVKDAAEATTAPAEATVKSLSETLSTTAGKIQAGQEFLAKPGVQTFLKGAAIAGGTLLADKILPGPKDEYHLSSFGVPLALVAPGETKTKLMIAGGSLVAGKVLDAILPASAHPQLDHILQPTWMDTVLTTGAIFAPVSNPQAKMALIGGSWVFGRMTGMNTVESGLSGAGLGMLTYKFTHNAALSLAVGGGSWLASRIFHH